MTGIRWARKVPAFALAGAASGQIDSGGAVNIDRIQHGRLSANVRRLIR